MTDKTTLSYAIAHTYKKLGEISAALEHVKVIVNSMKDEKVPERKRAFDNVSFGVINAALNTVPVVGTFSLKFENNSPSYVTLYSPSWHTILAYADVRYNTGIRKIIDIKRLTETRDNERPVYTLVVV